MKRAKFAAWHELILAILVVALMLWAARVEPDFVSIRAQTALSSHVWELALLAIPMLLIIISGGIDLSVGSTVALSAVAFGLTHKAGQPPVVAAAASIMTGLACGAANGWFVSRLRVHPLIVTLATLAAFRGIAEGISLAKPVSGFHDGFLQVARGSIGGIPYPGIGFLVLAALAWVVLTRTATGRTIFTLGHNETAARFTGLPVERLKLGLYAFSGAVAGIASVVLVSRHNTAKADLASGIELDVITAVVLGGASINGGRGTIIGMALGVLLIHETREFVSWHWRRDELNLIVTGCLLIGSVLLYRLFHRQRQEDA